MLTITHKDNILRTFILLVQTTRLVLKYTDSYLYKNADLSTTKFIVLQALSRNNGIMTPSKIAEWTQTERHNITSLIERMKREGLVITERDTIDRRTVNVILTDKGKEVLNQVWLVSQEVVERVMSSISYNDAIQLEKILTVLRQNAYRGLYYQ